MNLCNFLANRVRFPPKKHTIVSSVIRVHFATKSEKRRSLDRKPTPLIHFNPQSIASKGFLRPGAAYTPPQNFRELLANIVGNKNSATLLGDDKPLILLECSKTFNHSVPNSILHAICTFGDVCDFYARAVHARTPLDALRTAQLPANLHVQYDAHRWRPGGGGKFAGTAFSGSETLVTGIKHRK